MRNDSASVSAKQKNQSHGIVWFVLSMAILISPALVGCGGGKVKVPVVPVRGQVLFKNRPANGALVVFHPLDGDEKVARIRPHGTVDDEGFYELTTYEPGDGAPASRYRVTVTWRKKITNSAGEQETPADAVDELKGKYADPDQSKFEVTVSEGDTELSPLTIQ